MNNNSTHVLRELPSKNTTLLVRCIHNMIIGMRIRNEVRWGDDPGNQQHRSFVDDDSARKWLRRIANADQATLKGKICKRCGCPPQEVIVCPDSNDGAHQLDYRELAEVDSIDAEPRIKVVN